jgi:hypothetical protein
MVKKLKLEPKKEMLMVLLFGALDCVISEDVAVASIGVKSDWANVKLAKKKIAERAIHLSFIRTSFGLTARCLLVWRGLPECVGVSSAAERVSRMKNFAMHSGNQYPEHQLHTGES